MSEEEVTIPTSIVGRVGHLEHQVGGISRQLASSQAIQEATSDRIDGVAKTLDKVLDSINKPPAATQWWPIIIGVVSVLGIINVFATQALQNIKDMTDLRFTAMEEVREARLETVNIKYEHLTYQHRHLDAAFHNLTTRINVLAEETAVHTDIDDYGRKTRKGQGSN
jgi:hypothetical protein